MGDGVALGHRRLSIIDLTGSHQPMSSAAGSCHICFNGEILNFAQLRGQLSYPFRSSGDTEVLLAAYLRWGAAHVRRLEGQFAYAIFDQRSQDLWLFRDRLGVLPLYYYQARGVFAFASEVKALLPLIGQMLAVDEESLGDYLTHRSVPAPHTLFQGVRKLRAGHHLRVDAAGRTEEVAYWRICSDPAAPAEPAHAVDLVDSALRASVDRALVADVPVGAYLSGGVDSSLIVALMRRARPEAPLLTFAAGFSDSPSDERGYARQMAAHVASEHHEVVVSPSDFTSLWPYLTYQRDAPLSEPADIAVFKLAQLARRHVKVVLSGEGSDELFAGYPKYSAAAVVEAAAVLPLRLRRLVAAVAEVSMGAHLGRLGVPLRVLTEATTADRAQAWFSPFTSHERRRLLGRDGGRGPSPMTWPPGRRDLVHRMLYADCHHWLSDNLLERGDRMSMAASLELRPPFLDRELVELAFSLPTTVKLRAGERKWVVKQVARRYVPEVFVSRPKVGFRVPLDQWFRSDLRELIQDLLLPSTSWVSTVLDRSAIQEMVNSHVSGRQNHDIRLWTLLGLEIWHQTFFVNTLEDLQDVGAA